METTEILNTLQVKLMELEAIREASKDVVSVIERTLLNEQQNLAIQNLEDLLINYGENE